MVKTKAEALKLVKQCLWNGKGSKAKHQRKYICDQLDDLFWNYRVNWQAREELLQIISDRLGGVMSLDLWLEAQGVDRHEMTDYRMQQHRLQWLDQLIAEFN